MPFEIRQCLYRHNDPVSRHWRNTEQYTPEVFRDYAMTNCVLECRAQHIMDECGCLPYFYPRFKSMSDKELSCNVTGLAKLSEKYGKIWVPQFCVTR